MLNLTGMFNAVAGLPNPSATASVSVRSTSGAESDEGSRPALNCNVLLAWLRGGNETSAPAGGTVPATGPPVNVPLTATCPQAAVTCCCPTKVASVPASNDVALASGAG